MKILSCNCQPHAQTRQSLRAWAFFVFYELSYQFIIFINDHQLMGCSGQLVVLHKL